MGNTINNYYGLDVALCPYCDYDNGTGDGEVLSGQTECSGCNKKFDCEPEYSVSFNTRTVPCWNGEPHKWNKPLDLGKGKSVRNCHYCSKSDWQYNETAT